MPRFAPLSRPQYAAIIRTGTLPGYTSPMDTDANYDALIRVTRADDMDPRWPLAFTWSEGHQGSDPGLVAASVNNLGGVKWVGQAGAYDSGIPADTGGTYAGFPDLTGYFGEFVRIMHNSIIGPPYAADDLIAVVEHYTNGPGTGHNKVDQYHAYVRDYPPGGANVVTGADIIVKARTYIGQANSDGIDGNGPHPWAYWCEAFAESIPRSFGLTIPRMGSAVVDGGSHALNTTDPPANGAWCFFDEQFYFPDGHVGFWDAEQGQLLGTVTDGTGVGYRPWGPQTPGYMGWIMPDGASEEAPVPDVVTIPLPDGRQFDVAYGFLHNIYQVVPEAQRLKFFGYPLSNDVAARITDADGTVWQGRAQFWERTTMLHDPRNPPGEWQDYLAREDQLIEEAAA